LEEQRERKFRRTTLSFKSVHRLRQSNFSTESASGSDVVTPSRREANVLQPSAEPVFSLPRRDFIILPLLSLLTIAVLFAAAEVTTRVLWPSEDRGYCMYFDPVSGPHGKANCTSVVKIPEAPAPVVQRFNSCGYRSEASCGAKTPGTYRIDVLGSSIAEGFMIPYQEMLATVMTRQLSRTWKRPVEFENLAAEGCPPIYAYRHLWEALKLHPDAVVLVVNPWDLEQDVDPKLFAMRDDPMPITRAPAPAVKLSPLQQLQAWTHESRGMLVAQHYLLQNEDTFLKLYVVAGGDHTSFVRYPFDARWRRRFAMTDTLLGEMADKIHAAGALFLVMAVPERAQVLMLRKHDLPPGIDPYAFTREISAIAKRHGILFVDGLNVFSSAKDPEALFYVVDGHATPVAHRMMGDSIAATLAEQRSQHLSQ
jgi:hypothetical protein